MYLHRTPWHNISKKATGTRPSFRQVASRNTNCTLAHAAATLRHPPTAPHWQSDQVLLNHLERWLSWLDWISNLKWNYVVELLESSSSSSSRCDDSSAKTICKFSFASLLFELPRCNLGKSTGKSFNAKNESKDCKMYFRMIHWTKQLRWQHSCSFLIQLQKVQINLPPLHRSARVCPESLNRQNSRHCIHCCKKNKTIATKLP